MSDRDLRWVGITFIGGKFTEDPGDLFFGGMVESTMER